MPPTNVGPHDDDAAYVTLTRVAKRDDTLEDPCDVLLSEGDRVPFVGHEDAVPHAAHLLDDPSGYVTLTVVMNRTEGDPSDSLLRGRTHILAVGHQDGVTGTAIALGADPTSWP